MTEKFTGADLANLAREAALCALEEEDENETEIEAVYMRHVEKAISSGSSTASPEPSAEMLQMYNAFSRRGY
jgi:SpoVK/Ycf46/Vps4 family AAA+-type ATPase